MHHARIASSLTFLGSFAAALSLNCTSSPLATLGGSTWTGCSGQGCVEVGACKPGQSSAQFRKLAVPAAALEPGVHTWASVTFDNCSGIAWSAGSFALHPVAPLDASVWGTSRVALPADVPNGSRVTIPIPLHAPTTSGAYPFVWRIEGDATGALEERSKPVTISVQYSPDCSKPGPAARFQGWDLPAVTGAGQPFTAGVTFANCGNVPWKKDTGYSLQSTITPADAWGAANVPLPVDVPPLAAITLPLALTAPATQGTYDFAWKLKVGDTSIDDGTPLGHIAVLESYKCPDTGPAARFVREKVPAAMNGNTPFETTETFANCGKQPWDATWHLGAVAPSDDSVWSAGRVSLPAVVQPGYAVTIPIHGRSPGVLQAYPYRWALVQDGAGAIDEPSPSRTVNVTCLPACTGRSCGDDGCGGSCGSCGGGDICDGSSCLADNAACGELQWWNRPTTDSTTPRWESYNNCWDTDLSVSSGTPVQLRHASQLLAVHNWTSCGYAPTFLDLANGQTFEFFHLRPQTAAATDVNRIYPGGFIVGLSGGDTPDTGHTGASNECSTGAHLCVHTYPYYTDVFPPGQDACH